MLKFTIKNETDITRRLNRAEELIREFNDIVFGLRLDVEAEEIEPSADSDGSES